MLNSVSLFTSLLLAMATARPSGISQRTPGSGGLVPRACATKAEKVDGVDTNGKGVVIHNADSETRSFFMYDNSCDNVPSKYVTIGASGTGFIPFSAGFQGRVVRGTEELNLDGKPHRLGTWLEMSLDSQGWAWGDVSLIRGCDGPVTIQALDSSGVIRGFKDTSVLFDAPANVLFPKDSGVKVINSTELEGANPPLVIPAVVSYLSSKLDYSMQYIDDFHDNPVITSTNGRFSATFYQGRH
ncbi:hypothetical protein F4776DRAFT_190895 [Hypoxylon sp. NC0597]|nr:hypothetical protein F4776DRAFT_190895 [Hypoxylon sp. NC0597]